MRALGRSVDDFFEVYRTPARERFRRWPVLAAAWTGVSAVERVVLADRVVRLARISGQIVVAFTKPPAPARATASSEPELAAADRDG